jgi:hypothetical protein
MKKLVLATALSTICLTSFAQWHHHYGRPVIVQNDWVTPMIIGGLAGAVIMRETQKPQPVIVQQPQVEQQITIMNGVVYRKQYIYIDGVLTEVLVKQ